MKYAGSNRGPGVRSSTGAALLAFILVLILSSTWLLLSDLNGHTGVYIRRADTELALNQAKQALLHYAMNYPDLRVNPEKGPGFLPCPAVRMFSSLTSCSRWRSSRVVNNRPNCCSSAE